MAYYKISAQTLTAIADAVRSKIGTEEEIPCAELAEAIASIDIGEVVLESAGVAFSSQKVDPDVNYKVGRNWLADLVSVVQKMAGKKSDMTLDDVIYWLNRVLFIPQGNAESSFCLSFSSSVSGILPDVQIGVAESAFSISFSSEASGKLIPELNGARVSYNGVLLPGIPDEMLSYFPYAWIRKNASTGYYDLILSEYQPWYYSSDSSGIKQGQGTDASIMYRILIADADSADSWALEKASNTWYTIDSDRTVLWSNHDIPHGSIDTTDVYFYGTEPNEDVSERSVEYLRSTGTQYINTKIVPAANMEIEMKYSALSLAYYGNHMLSTGGFYFPFPKHDSSGYFLFTSRFGEEGSINTTDEMPDTYTVRAFPGDKVIVNGTEYDAPSTGASTVTDPLYMFTYGGSPGSSYYTGQSRIYYCKIWQNGELAYDFEPKCISGEVGMWDSVNGKFYKNAGAGSFIGGPSV